MKHTAEDLLNFISIIPDKSRKTILDYENAMHVNATNALEDTGIGKKIFFMHQKKKVMKKKTPAPIKKKDEEMHIEITQQKRPFPGYKMITQTMSEDEKYITLVYEKKTRLEMEEDNDAMSH